MVRAVIAFGSNEGDRVEHFRAAKRALVEGGFEWEGSSIVVESAPYGHAPDDAEAPWYLNAVAWGNTARSPHDLVDWFQSIERGAGREAPEVRGASSYHRSRPLDLDLLFYGDETVHSPAVTVPHPGIPDRRFVLVPLATALPTWIHPTLKRSMPELLEACVDPTLVRFFAPSIDVL